MASWLQPWSTDDSATAFDPNLYAQSLQLESLFGDPSDQSQLYDEFTFGKAASSGLSKFSCPLLKVFLSCRR